MNHSIYSADRATHVKIVVLALIVGVVAGLSIAAHLNSDGGYAQAARVLKAGAPVTMTSSGSSMVR